MHESLPPSPSPGACPAPGLERSVRRRAAWMVLPLLAAFVLLSGRVAQIQVCQEGRWTAAAERQRFVHERQDAPRGEVRGSNGKLLASSLPRKTVIVDRKLLQNPAQVVQVLAPLLRREPYDLLAHMDRPDRRVVYLARNIEPELAQEISAKLAERKLRGVGFENSFCRSYPCGTLASHLLGWAGADGGMEGLELGLNGLLRGTPGYFIYEKDAARQSLARGDEGSFVSAARSPKPGLNVTLTLDPRVQHVLEEELDRLCADFQPNGATGVVLDVRTGAVLAQACLPDYDPNQPAVSDAAARRNRLLTDQYEPGSTFKTFIASLALERGACGRGDRFDCESGAWHLPWRTLHDAHPLGLLTFDDVLIHSSNIGAAKIGLRLGADGVFAAVQAFGFGQLTHMDLPGEAKGRVRPRASWTKDSLLSIPMGQEIAVTPIQLARGYAAMVNGGMLFRPQIIARLTNTSGEVLYEMRPQPVRRVLSATTSAAMREIMTQVVERGTGRAAWCKEYPLGGKTGTAQKVENGHYSHDKYVGSFCGFAPAGEPQLVCLVTVDEPHKGLGYYGGTVAAPAVREVLRRSLNALGVPPRTPAQQATAIADFQRLKKGGG